MTMRQPGHTLRYVTDQTAGIRRVRHGRGFAYVLPSGSKVTRLDTLERIKQLAIPPAWTDVWICAEETGHIQAVGRDARGRKQYIYHRAWRALRDEAKFDRMAEFARALPRLRRRCRDDIKQPGLSQERIVATVVLLLDTTLVRVGSEQYAASNRTYGLTTLRSRHVHRNGSSIRLRFRGKAGHLHDVDILDPRVSSIIRRLEDLPGQELFQYLDADGRPTPVTSDAINSYLAMNMDGDFTAKDFRTWGASALALKLLSQGPTVDRTEAERHVGAVIRQVAQSLRNTPRICRQSYVHPAVIDAYLSGRLRRVSRQASPVPGLRQPEAALLNLLSAGSSPARGAGSG